MNTKSSITLAFLTLNLLPLRADDTGFGLEVGAEKKISKDLTAEVEGEYRTQDGLSETERWSIGASLDYKLAKWLKADAGYCLIGRNIPERLTEKGKLQSQYWSPRHRAFVSLTGSWKLPAHWELSLRERYQYTYEVERNVERHNPATGERLSDKVKGGDADQLLRSRVQLKWSRKRSPWAPYVNVEMLNDLRDAMGIDQMRYTAGVDYKLNKKNTLGASYRFKDKSDKDDDKGHLFSVQYSYKF